MKVWKKSSRTENGKKMREIEKKLDVLLHRFETTYSYMQLQVVSFLRVDFVTILYCIVQALYL